MDAINVLNFNFFLLLWFVRTVFIDFSSKSATRVFWSHVIMPKLAEGTTIGRTWTVAWQTLWQRVHSVVALGPLQIQAEFATETCERLPARVNNLITHLSPTTARLWVVCACVHFGPVCMCVCVYTVRTRTSFFLRPEWGHFHQREYMFHEIHQYLNKTFETIQLL